jgi:hypothetical protein
LKRQADVIHVDCETTRPRRKKRENKKKGEVQNNDMMAAQEEERTGNETGNEGKGKEPEVVLPVAPQGADARRSALSFILNGENQKKRKNSGPVSFTLNEEKNP